MKKKSKKKSTKSQLDLFDQAKILLDKADKIIEEKIIKVKKSRAYKVAADSVRQVEDFIEVAQSDYKKSDTKKSVDKAIGKAEAKAEKAMQKAIKNLEKARELGQYIVKEADERLEQLKSPEIEDNPAQKRGRPKGSAVNATVAEPAKPKAAKVSTAKPAPVKSKKKVNKPAPKKAPAAKSSRAKSAPAKSTPLPVEQASGDNKTA